MLRKVRVDGPAERLDDLVGAARRAMLELDDYAIDTTAEYGWPGRGDGRAYVLVVVDDDEVSVDDVVSALRTAHEHGTGEPSDWIVSGGSFVYLPDGLEPEWYDAVVPLAEALHSAERDAVTDRIAALRFELVGRLEEAMPLAGQRFAAFAAFLEGPIRRGQERR
jgi:hypothetical protein